MSAFLIVSRRRPAVSIMAPVSLLLATASTAHAQWSFDNLSPPALNISTVTAIRGGVPVGYASQHSGAPPVAGYWSGDTGSSWTSLHPAGATTSRSSGSSATSQVGHAHVGGVFRASRWSGTADSWVDLAPNGATISRAWGMDGESAVGSASFGGGMSHASVWTGGVDTWTSLHPVGATTSVAFGGGGGQQVGQAEFNDVTRAAMWTGSSGSYVDLHPAGATRSVAFNSSGTR